MRHSLRFDRLGGAEVMGPATPKVSVMVLGNEPALHTVEAVTSALRQKTDFRFEIVIGNDCLSNASRQSLQELDVADRERIRILPEASGRGPNRDFIAAIRTCCGQHLALLNCDDFWTDEHKLQQQVDYLDEFQNCSLCFHKVQCVNENGETLPTTFPTAAAPISDFEQLLRDQFIPASSAVIRREAIDSLPRWFEYLKIWEWPVYLLAALRGEIGYIDRLLSALRQTEKRAEISDLVRENRYVTLMLRRVRSVSGAHEQRLIDLKLSDLHRLISHEMDRRGRGDDADRHRRMCFLYGGWQADLPLRTKISHAIRPCRLLHLIAVFAYETVKAPKRYAPVVAFAVSTVWHQPSWILRIGRAVTRKGIRGIEREWRILHYLYGAGPQRYARWIQQFDTLSDDDRIAIGRRIELMRARPKFSVIMPVYNTPEEFLRKAIESVVRQLYPDWELCIADDASTEPHVRRIIGETQTSEGRIRCQFRKERGNISAASNSAMELASGDFVVFMDHDDELAEHALYMVAEEINRQPQAQMIYSDEDRLDSSGRRVDPYFKTDWNPGLMLSQNMVCHLAVFNRQLVLNQGGFREEFEGGQDYDLAIRCMEQIPPEQIRHIPAILYHWRQVPGSVSKDSRTAVKAHDAGARAIREHLERQKTDASVETVTDRGSPHYRVKYSLAAPPKVTVIIPTKDRLDLLQRCVEGLLNDTDYPLLEVLIIDNESSQPATLDYFAALKEHDDVRVLEYRGGFNYSSINNFAVQHARGGVLCLLNNDTEITHADWLREMVSHVVRDEIGAVGAKLLYPDDSIQHAGVLIGFGGAAGHTFSMLPVETPVHFGRLETIQDVSCVTAACMVLRKSVFEEVGGLDEEAFAVAYNDVDLCLRIVSAGYRIVWTPYAQLYHHESASRGRSITQEAMARDRRESIALRQRWSERIAADPNMNPNVSVEYVDYRPAFPPRTRRPWI